MSEEKLCRKTDRIYKTDFVHKVRSVKGSQKLCLSQSTDSERKLYLIKKYKYVAKNILL